MKNISTNISNYAIILTFSLSYLSISFFSIGPIDIDFLKIGLLFLFLIFLVFKIRKIFFPFEYKVLLFLIMWMSITSLWSKEKEYALSYLFGFIINSAFLFFVIQNFYFGKNLLWWTYRIPLVIFVMLPYITFEFKKIEGLRHTWHSYSHVATCAASVYPLSLYLLLFSKKKLEKIYAFILFSGILFIILFTEARGAFFAVIFSSIVLLWCIINSKNWRLILKKIVLFTLIIFSSVVFFYIFLKKVGLFMLFEHYKARILTTFIPNTNYLKIYGYSSQYWYWRDSLRYHIYKGTIKIIKDYFPFGAGWGSFKVLYPYYGPTFNMVEIDPHSTYLRFFSELGIIGILLYLLFIFLVFKKFLYSIYILRKAKSYENYTLIIAYTLSFFNIILIGLIREICFEPALYLFSGIGIVIGCRKKAIQRQTLFTYVLMDRRK